MSPQLGDSFPRNLLATSPGRPRQVIVSLELDIAHSQDDVQPTGRARILRKALLDEQPVEDMTARMVHDLPIGRALRRFRRLNGVKQGHVADLLAVSQASVSRWEAGLQEPEDVNRDRIASIIAASASEAGDAALKRLVNTSSLPVHLVCDATHRLLAASPSRTASWSAGAAFYLGTSLWPFASEEIAAAEDGLAGSGWFERACQSICFETGDNGCPEIPVTRSLVQWETLPLSDGRVGRLTTTIVPHA